MSSSAAVLQSSSTLIDTPKSSAKSFSLRHAFALVAGVAVGVVGCAASAVIAIAVAATAANPLGILASMGLGGCGGYLAICLGKKVYVALKGPTP